MASEIDQKIIKFVQELLSEEENKSTITPAMIEAKMEIVLAMSPKWQDGVDRQAVIDELIRRFSFWIGTDATLKNNEGHVDWLTASRKRNWRYWQRYREWLERKHSLSMVDALDRSTDAVLELLEDPMREGGWDRRGMVVGHVQSGKTSHYSGLICKAADAGYKIIIVLAGIHNNLRSQTQMRLDEAFLGYETGAFGAETLKPIGVHEFDSDPAIRPNYATNRSQNGDFNSKVAKNFGITPEERPWLFVVKKNKTILERLQKWLNNHVANTTDSETGRRIITNLPLLLIDDEADNASVDTREVVRDENGKPDEDHQPTAINSAIRRILWTFSRSAYVGYTATPFANIFIDERSVTRDEGSDLFPEAFIINLSAPSNYIGPARVFGAPLEDGGRTGLPLIRTVDDFNNWLPTGHKNGYYPLYEGRDALPPSLETAIDAFVLGCAVRSLRRQDAEHSSMLVHVTRFTSVQQAVHSQVEAYVRHLRQRLHRRTADGQRVLERLKKLWTTDFVPTTEAIPHGMMGVGFDVLMPSWGEVEEMLAEAVADIQVRMINGTAKDALDYAENAETGLKVIAIGGDKLARGLTLEGLTVSYFLRASRMYDTLMQMGRWFGYRPGYLDLCRLYTTTDLVDWFEHIADASEELREEFDLMAASGGTPRDYGLKVKSHPTLMVTSSIKMRNARDLYLSFSGSLPESVTFCRDAENIKKNYNAALRLIEALRNPEPDPKRVRGGTEQNWTGYLWSHVTPDLVIDFLEDYRSHPDAHKANAALIAPFIKSLVAKQELTDWTVALIGGGQEVHHFNNEISVRLLKRSNDGNFTDRYSIGRLMSPRDEAIDLTAEEWEEALARTRAAFNRDAARNESRKEPDMPNGPAIRSVRPKEKAVLFLYPIDPRDIQTPGSAELPPMIGFAVSLPKSESGTPVKYRVNNVYWEQEQLGVD